ncbi:MAG TPA: hypothetical protein PK597_04085 [Oscillospiraceae bacterium]|nr:hypothetical protein [Oscillospiraceae bacterium]
MRTILQKLASRKFWAAVAGIATGIAIALGAGESEVSLVTGAVTAALSVITYIVTEGKVDAAGVAAAIEAVQKAAEETGDAQQS